MSSVSAARSDTAVMWWAYLGYAIVATAGFFYVNIMPAIIDGLITGLGFSTAQAGLVGSANIYGASAGSFAAVFLVRRIAWRRTLLRLLLVLLAIDLLSLAVRDPALLAGVRALHGLAGGMIVGVAYSVMARTPSPDRAFGMLLLVQFGLGGLGVMLLPQLVPVYGAGILFLVLAALTLVALAILFALPATAQDGAGHDARRAPSILPLAAAALPLAALFLFQAGNMALAAFIVGLGERYGLARDFISETLGWATWIGAAGAVLVMHLGNRHGSVKPLAVAAVVTLAGCALFFGSAKPALFFAGNAATAITWSFVVPCLFGIVSRLDASGRMAALGGFVSKLGLASGPLAAGWMLREGNYPVLIAASIATLGLAMSAALVATWNDKFRN